MAQAKQTTKTPRKTTKKVVQQTEEPEKPRLKVGDIVILVVMAAIVISLAVFLVHQLSLKHEVTAARQTTDRIQTDIHALKAADARSLATPSFQKNNAAANLQALFKVINDYAKGTPTVASQIVTNTKDAQNVGVVYKYTGTKNPYFIRIVTTKPKGSTKWQFAAISGGSDQAKLENNGK